MVFSNQNSRLPLALTVSENLPVQCHHPLFQCHHPLRTWERFGQHVVNNDYFALFQREVILTFGFSSPVETFSPCGGVKISIEY